MTRIVSVSPNVTGWTVSAESFEPMVFFSGAKAEAAARSLADKAASGGHHTEIRIFLRDGSLAGRFVRTPDLQLAG